VFPYPDGYTDLATTYMLINSVLNWPNACYSFYDRTANKISLLSDSGTYFVGSVTPGQTSTLQNSQCTLNGNGSSVTPSGNSLTINVALTFTGAFGGAKNIYLNAQDSGGLE